MNQLFKEIHANEAFVLFVFKETESHSYLGGSTVIDKGGKSNQELPEVDHTVVIGVKEHE